MRDQDRANGAPVSPARGNQDRRKVDKRLDTWKEIGAFFGRDERTVKRWEATRGLPVHRVPGSGRATVYAYVSELERWLESEKLWQTYLALGGSLDPEPDTQSPFFDARAPRPRAAHGRAGLRVLRRSRV